MGKPILIFMKKEEEADMISKLYSKGKLPLTTGNKGFHR